MATTHSPSSTNPTNDASDIADALRGAGFEVILKTDADQATMKDAIRVVRQLR